MCKSTKKSCSRWCWAHCYCTHGWSRACCALRTLSALQFCLCSGRQNSYFNEIIPNRSWSWTDTHKKVVIYFPEIHKLLQLYKIHVPKSLTKSYLKWNQPLLWFYPVGLAEHCASEGKRLGSWSQELKAGIERGKPKICNIVLLRSSCLHIMNFE